MMVVMIAAVPPITMIAVAMGAVAVVKTGAMKAAGVVEIPAMVEIAAAKAPVVVETAAEPKPDANRSCVAISAIIGIILFGISVGRLIIGGVVWSIEGWVGRRAGGTSEAGSAIDSDHLIVFGGLGSGLVELHDVPIDIDAVRRLGRCGCGVDCGAESENCPCENGVFERHGLGAPGVHPYKRNDAGAYSAEGDLFSGVQRSSRQCARDRSPALRTSAMALSTA